MQAIPLSDHIDYALESLEIAEKRSKEKGDFEIDMGTYHDVITLNRKKFCMACLAGISMLNRAGMLESGFAKTEAYITRESEVPLEEIDIYEAVIDALRGGYPKGALKCLTGEVKSLDSYHIVGYHTDPESFKSDMKNMSISLREQGY